MIVASKKVPLFIRKIHVSFNKNHKHIFSQNTQFFLYLGYTTKQYDIDKQTNNHSISFNENEIGIIEEIFNIDNSKYAFLNCLRKEKFTFTIKNSNENVKKALMEYNNAFFNFTLSGYFKSLISLDT